MDESHIIMNDCTTKCIIENQDVGKMLIKWKSKAPIGQKVQCHMVESLHLNTMVVAFSHHFRVYGHNRQQITQLILSAKQFTPLC
jgi:hypothetical protein